VEEIKNKVAQSGLITLDLADFYPRGARKTLDLKPWLYEGIMLREKDFRQSVKEHAWEQYQNSYVAVFCSEEAIIPQWAYMLIGAKLAGVAKQMVFGSLEALETILAQEAMQKVEVAAYAGQRVILKGCGDVAIPPQAYLQLAARLQPVVKSLMFGEACSTVPIYKKPRTAQ
jgi:hypothetical protein